MIDIHAHILPGIDDGSISLEQSLIMADQAASTGTRAMVASVHSNQIGRFENFESLELRNLYHTLVEAMKREKIPMKLARGMEIFCFDGKDTVTKIREKRLIPLNKSNNYLIEFAFDETAMNMEAIIREMLEAGYIPVIAHPERYYCIQENPNYIYEWRVMGALVQVNKGSILGRFGYDCGRTAEVLLSHNLINCFASDTHSNEFRTPDLLELDTYLRNQYSDLLAKLLLDQNPARILMNQKLLQLEAPRPVNLMRWY